MTTPMITIHNVVTGEIIEREMNADELAQLEIDRQAGIDAKNAKAEQAVAKAVLLTRLGITAEEATLLLS